MSSVRNEILLLQKSLTKAISSEPCNDSEVLDILLALGKINITIEMLRETKIGNSVYEVKKKFPAGHKCHNESRDIIALWKKQTTVSKPSSDGIAADINKKKDTGKISSIKESDELQDSGEADDDGEVEKNYDSLSQTRRKIMDLFSSHLSLSTNKANIVKFLAYNVEASINALHCSIADSKSYIAKARSLSYNLKRNERLRLAILDGDLAPEDLVKLAPSELATDEQKDARDAESKASTLERRADYYQIARAGIQRANGIDPEAGGEYTCRKCKGNKTTHYSMQTRSADEPMTVFVGCLTCGNRWRCT